MEAYDTLPAGRVLAVEVVGDPGGGVIGDLVAHRLSRIGMFGAVVDGPIRDVTGILRSEFPVWARAITLGGMSASELRIEKGREINLGGVPVREGDFLSAGPDGICVVKTDYTEGVFQAAEAIKRAEEEAHRRIAAGSTILEAYPSIRQ